MSYIDMAESAYNIILSSAITGVLEAMELQAGKDFLL